MIREGDIKAFGFWVYLMTDLVIFAVLFAVFNDHRNHTFGGPSGKDLFQISTVVAETFILLTSSFTCALGTLFIFRNQKKAAFFAFLVTCILGLSFLFIEIFEFSEMINSGAGPERSAFLSSYFTLVGTHGFHISVGLLWMAVLMVRMLKRPLIPHVTSQIYRMAFFWHFLDFVWIFIFTVVYGMEFLNA